MQDPRVRAVLLFVLALAFGVLIFGGVLIHRDKPPVPERVTTQAGTLVFTGEDIKTGQRHYFTRGGQHMGSIWGHGSYLAPDWSADYLHRMGLYTAARALGLDDAAAAGFTQANLDALPAVEKATVQAKVAEELRKNRYDPATRALLFTDSQLGAFDALARHYTTLFREGAEHMGIQPGVVSSDTEGRNVTSFFAWLAWAAVAERPGQSYSYTSNWPYDPLVGNVPLPGALIWSIASVVILILVLGLAIFLYARYMHEKDYDAAALVAFQDPAPTPSQRATVAYFLIAMALLFIQTLLGALTAHFTVEGGSFLGIPFARLFPYAAVRTWHLQLAIFWIATCFLASGLFIAPLVGREPKGQRRLVIFLLLAVVVVVLGALSGSWLSIMGYLGENGFFLGHQGYEYVELGRVWQIGLILGMVIWLVLVVRAIRPALGDEKDRGGLTHLLLYSAVAIPLFYMAGLLYGNNSDLSDAEYWRWWVVHLWVEGFFEVFATVMLAFILSRIGAVSSRFALTSVYVSIFLYLGSGVIGTFHHLYWAGTPTPIIALGAVFSALEVVPLALLGFETATNMRAVKSAGRDYAYKWPLYFFVAVAFWNVVGAGVFGFLINPPIVLYYVQGMNTTPLHAHTALFGVYGFLAIALMLFSMRNIVRRGAWSDGLLKASFWCLNGGLMGMTVLSLAPAGFYQMSLAVRFGTWFARSPEVTSGPTMRLFSYLRIVPDVVFMVGSFLLIVFVLRAVLLGRRKAS